MLNKSYLTLICLLSLSFFQLSAEVDGESLYFTNCARCHTIGRGDMTGPDLKNVRERLEDEWMISFVQSSTAMIKSGDDYAVEVYEKYRETEMPDHDLSDEEVLGILAYIDEASAAEPLAISGGDAGNMRTYVKVSPVDPFFKMVFWGSLILVISIVFALSWMTVQLKIKK